MLHGSRRASDRDGIGRGVRAPTATSTTSRLKNQSAEQHAEQQASRHPPPGYAPRTEAHSQQGKACHWR